MCRCHTVMSWHGNQGVKTMWTVYFNWQDPVKHHLLKAQPWGHNWIRTTSQGSPVKEQGADLRWVSMPAHKHLERGGGGERIREALWLHRWQNPSWGSNHPYPTLSLWTWFPDILRRFKGADWIHIPQKLALDLREHIPQLTEKWDLLGYFPNFLH